MFPFRNLSYFLTAVFWQHYQSLNLKSRLDSVRILFNQYALIHFVILTMISGCSTFFVQRRPASEPVCGEVFARLAANSSVYSFKSKSSVEKLSLGLFGRRESTKIYFDRYKETLENLRDIPLESLNADQIDFGDALEFEDILAYWDILIRKAYLNKSTGGLRLAEIEDILNFQNGKAYETLFTLKRSFDRERTLTKSEIEDMLTVFSKSLLEHPDSLGFSSSKEFERLALRSFLLKVGTAPLQDLFSRQAYKNPVLYQRFFDRLSRIMSSRVATVARNVVLPILQISQGVVPLPLKEVDFIMDDEMAELIIKKGFVQAWPEIESRYRRIGITTLRFNQAARIYRPVGLIGFMITAYLLYQENADQMIADQSEASEELILQGINESEELVKEISEAVSDPLFEVMVAEFETANGRSPTASELEELRLLFSFDD